jgi:precorrin-6Y C5,15-methyltransferase (decarboxylating)
VAIEWLRAGRGMRAIAVERDLIRAERIAFNARRLGVPELVVREGEAPDAMADLPIPDAIFVGGGVGTSGLLHHCWSRLEGNGRLVANAVTVTGEAALLAFHARHGGRLLRLSVSRAETVGGRLVWRPAMPVTQLSTRKTCAAAS